MRLKMPAGFSKALQQSITYKTDYGYVAPNHAYHTASADFDGDGNDDLIISSRDSIILFARGLGNGAFESPFSTITEGTDLISHGKLLCRSGIAVGDFNGDGKPDISITGFIGNCPSVDNSHLSSKTLTFLNTMEWPTGTSTTETRTTYTSMFKLVTSITTASTTTGSITEHPASRAETSNDELVQQNAELLEKLESLELQVSVLQGTMNLLTDLNDQDSTEEKTNIIEVINLVIAGIALVLGGIAIFLERNSVSQILEHTSLPQTNDLTIVVPIGDRDDFYGFDEA
jgi:hypothetical protein